MCYLLAKGLRRKISCKDLGKTDCKGWLWRLEQEDEESVKEEAPRGSQSDDEGISNQVEISIGLYLCS